MKITYRKAERADVPEQIELQRAAFLPLFEKYQDEESPYNMSFGELEGKILNPLGCYLVILADGVAAGGIYVHPLEQSTEEMYLCGIYVRPELHGNGIAQAAILHAEELFPECRRWTLDVPSRERKNLHLYEKLGYKPTGSRERINELLTIAAYEKIIVR